MAKIGFVTTARDYTLVLFAAALVVAITLAAFAFIGPRRPAVQIRLCPILSLLLTGIGSLLDLGEPVGLLRLTRHPWPLPPVLLSYNGLVVR